ncbi:DUF4261 domain-containing protein [Plantactinospora sp. KLBMP9567]|uniref:DUF4261 domain-containing protein n=1 Tax=Plantactinospora sp. KLBMP9567 TaxID=3085900 RepID=UPI0029815B92|nr:DUF4261 domain-containing protein [Plantactinospora sp. KLBMP9567]MDW5326177.1 DUF4261 domain-containing protein [Plantactinospora sp. KLBMP9567]
MTGDLVYGVRLFVPGTAATMAQWQGSLGRSGLTLDGQSLTSETLGFRAQVEWVENDGSFSQAFGHGTMSVEEQCAVVGAGSALILDLPVYLGAAAGEVAMLISALGDAGALGVRLEQSKLGWPVARWIRSLESGDPWMLYRCAVMVLQDRGVSRSCGMHAFGLPDAQVEAPPAEANQLLGSLNVYQLAEDPVLVSGDTFTPDLDTPRRRLERWPDDGYPPGRACHNPFGTWRLGAEGGEADSRGELRPVFIPPLVALLTAAEEKVGRGLRREEVERLTGEGVCMMMTHADAKNLERSRGYADLEPELVWRQWQVLRESRA